MVLHMQPVIYNWYLVTYDIDTKHALQARDSVITHVARGDGILPFHFVLDVRLTSVPVGSCYAGARPLPRVD